MRLRPTRGCSLAFQRQKNPGRTNVINAMLVSSHHKRVQQIVRKEIKLLLVTDQLDEKLTAFKFMFL